MTDAAHTESLPLKGGGWRRRRRVGVPPHSGFGACVWRGTPTLIAARSDLPLAGGGKRLRRGLRATLIVCSLGIACLLAAAGWIASLGPAPLGEGLAYSTRVVDRDGRLLRPYTNMQGRWRLPATREDVDPRFFNLLFAYEDKRFLDHHGVDALALGRALGQLLRNGHIVSGASTLSMQVARLLEPRTERTVLAKLRQMVRAIELERALSKDQILALYLSLAPYGGNLEGIRAASLAYFGKEPRRLTLAETALMVALPQSPEQRRPDRRCWRRIPPMRSWPRRPAAACIG
jgi:penicillin-binding protein 1C